MKIQCTGSCVVNNSGVRPRCGFVVGTVVYLAIDNALFHFERFEKILSRRFHL